MSKNTIYFPKYLKKIINDESEKNENNIIDVHIESYIGEEISSDSALLDNIEREFYECFGEFKGELRKKACSTKYKNMRFHLDDYRNTINDPEQNDLNKLIYYYNIEFKKENFERDFNLF